MPASLHHLLLVSLHQLPASLRKWIPPDLEAEIHHYKHGVGSFHLKNKEAKRELKVKCNNETLPFCSDSKHLGVTLDRSLTYRRHLESLRKKLTSRVSLLRWLAASGWVLEQQLCSSYPSPGALNHLVLPACLVPQRSYPPHWPWHQRRLANCDWMTASHTSEQPSNPRRHSTCWSSS